MPGPESKSDEPYFFTDEPHALAYHLEGQAIAVVQAQLAGRLTERHSSYSRSVIRAELDTEWVMLGDSRLFSGDCNMEKIRELDEIDGPKYITEIVGMDCRTDIFEGQVFCPVAAVILTGSVTLYQSPGFNPDIYESPEPDTIEFESAIIKSLPSNKAIWPKPKAWKQLSKIEKRRVMNETLR